MSLIIRPACQSPHLATVACWLHDLWWSAEGFSREATEAFLRNASGPDAPCALIAEWNGQPAGTAALEADDLPERRDLTPWLAGVLVHPRFRGRGIAEALVAEVRRRAAALGYERIWLFTPDQAAFYAKRGWSPEGAVTWRDQPATLMSHDLRPRIAIPVRPRHVMAHLGAD